MPQATPSARKASALYSSSPSGVLTAPFTGDLCYVHGPNTLTHTHTHTHPPLQITTRLRVWLSSAWGSVKPTYLWDITDLPGWLP